MSWPGANPATTWNQAGIAMPDMSSGSYTPEQWAMMQQQNWQQWSQWQHQYSQWQTHYGDKYTQQLHTVQGMGGVPPPPPTAVAPPPPPDKPPPPPPHENNQPLFNNKDNTAQPSNQSATQPRSNANYNVNAGTGNNQKSYSADPQPAVNTDALNKLAEEERLFDIQFQKWEEEIDKWRQENANHPDKQAYKDYEAKFEACRKQLLERRQQMKMKRANLLNSTSANSTGNTLVTTTIPTSSNQNSYSRHPQTQNTLNNSYERQYTHAQSSQQQKHSQNNSYERQYENRNNKNIEPQDRYESYDRELDEQQYAEDVNISPKRSQTDSSTFLQSSSSSKGIPGLDLVTESTAKKNLDVIDLSEEQFDKPSKVPDYSTISMGINTILGDEKIMNILSMVQGINPNQAGPNVSQSNTQGNKSQNFNQPQQHGNNVSINSGFGGQGPHDHMPGGIRPGIPQGGQNRQGGPGMQVRPNFNQSGPAYMQNGPGMNQGGAGMNQGRSGNNQGGPGMYQGGPGMQQGGPGSNQGRPGMQQGGPGTNQGPRPNGLGIRSNRPVGPAMQQGQNMQHGGPNMGPGGPNMRQAGPHMGQGGPNIRQAGPNMGQGGPNMRQAGPNMGQATPNMQGRLNMQHGGTNIQQGGVNMQGGPNMQTGHNMQQPPPLMAQRVPVPMQLNNGPGRQPLQDASSQQNADTYPPPNIPSQPPQPKWREDPLFTPSIVVEYEHKSLRLKARDFIEPVHTFDYNHISKEDEYKKKDFEYEADEIFTRKPRKSERDYGEDRLRDQGNRDIYTRDYERKGLRDDFRDMPRDIREIRGEPRTRDIREPRDLIEPRDFRDDDRFSRDRLRDRNNLDVYNEDRYEERRRDELDRHGNKRIVNEDMRDRDRRGRRDDSRDGRREDYRDVRREDGRKETGRREEYRDGRKNDRTSTSRDTETRKRGNSRESETSNNSKKAKNVKDVPLNKPLVMIDDLLEPPGREMRPEKIVIILRGIPGSGKSYLAKLIRDREAEHGGTARILSIDDYFMQEGEIEETDPLTGKTIKKPSLKYEYDESSEETYTSSLKRAFKRTITDGYFPFLIYDAPNPTLQSYADIWNFARQNGFQVYICTMELDVKACFKRQIHNRKLEDIEVVASRFFPTPAHHIQLEPTALLQSAAIQDVTMEDVQDALQEQPEAQDEVESVFTSKWEKMDDANKLARLDGTSKPLRPSQFSMEEFLQLDDWTPNTAKPGKKTVRWADIEESREQEKMRAIGFVVGQTDWNRMTDPTMGSSALTQTKYIERVNRK